jgi:hypothetical protein
LIYNVYFFIKKKTLKQKIIDFQVAWISIEKAVTIIFKVTVFSLWLIVGLTLRYEEEEEEDEVGAPAFV